MSANCVATLVSGSEEYRFSYQAEKTGDGGTHLDECEVQFVDVGLFLAQRVFVGCYLDGDPNYEVPNACQSPPVNTD
jgi:hypothetical protein